MTETKNILEEIVATYTKSKPVFIVTINEQDHTDDFGSIEQWTYACMDPPEESDEFKGGFLTTRKIKSGRVSADIFEQIKKQGYADVRNYQINPSKEQLSVVTAKEIAKKFHEGQYRNGSQRPYITHVEAVACRGRDDAEKILGWLHDVVEDTTVTLQMLRPYFDKEIIQGVNILTRNVNRTQYKTRIAKAPENIKRVKLYDVAHNTNTMRNLDIKKYEKTISRKVNDSMKFYIPIALSIDEDGLAAEITENIKPFMYLYKP